MIKGAESETIPSVDGNVEQLELSRCWWQCEMIPSLCKRVWHILVKTLPTQPKISTRGYLPAAAAAKSLQSCPTLWDPRDGSPPGSPVPGILQARTLEWVVIAFSNAWKWKVKVKSLSRVRFLAALWTAAYQAPPSMGFARQEYWSGLPLPSPDIYLGEVKIYVHTSCIWTFIEALLIITWNNSDAHWLAKTIQPLK